MTNAWDRQHDESGEIEPAMWFGRFDAYRLMGPERSLLGAYKEWSQKAQEGPAKWMPSAWKRNAEKWSWKARAEAWDMAEIQSRRVIWEERAEQIRQKEWTVANRLLERCEQMLAFGPARTVSADGQTIIEPTDWKFRDVPYAAKLASELARLAAELATERKALDVTSGGKPLPVIESVVFRYNDDD